MKECEEYKSAIDQADFYGMKGIRFSAGGYQALVLPDLGANLVELKDVKRGLSLLRSITDIDAFKARSHVFGLPVLFPPNRIANGEFDVGEKKYKFPVNDASKENHIHGFLRHRPWEVSKVLTVDENTAEVELSFNGDNSTDFYQFLPHEFEFKLLYRLTSAGLEQRVTITNKSATSMPMALGFHTAINVTFHPESDASNCRLIVSIGDKWELDEGSMPTGRLLPLNNEEEKFRSEGILPQGLPMLEHFTAKPLKFKGVDFNGAILENKYKGLKLIYEVGVEYKHWMIWNDTGDKGFICPEPQTWAVNAPNIGLPDEVTGMKTLAPGEVWKGNSRIYVMGGQL